MNYNYAQENIPDFDSLLKDAESVVSNLSAVKRFKFGELFSLQESGEYYKNDEVLQQIGFNNKATKKAKQNKEIKGVYLFYEDETPVYAGISRGIIRRLKNHFLGKSHFEASLAYLIARDKVDEGEKLYMDKRSNFPFEDYRPEIQSAMRENWMISIIPITDNYKMYFVEFYLACHLKTKWNCFETH